MKSEERKSRDFDMEIPLLEADSLKKAFDELSKLRFMDTLISENSDLCEHLLKFKGSKAEHNVDSLSMLLEVDSVEALDVIDKLVAIGFLTKRTDSYIIPLLYRPGSGVSWGKAFSNQSDLSDQHHYIELEDGDDD